MPVTARMPNARNRTSTDRIALRLLSAALASLLAACSTVAGAGPPADAETDRVRGAERTAGFPVAPPAREPQPDLDRAPAPPAPKAPGEPAPLEPFAMSLFEPGDWVQQYTFEWCVAASVQIAWNLAEVERRTARDDQGALWERARDLSSNPFRGADPGGWTDLLNEEGLGPYELVSIPEFDEAVRVAAAALRDTGRSVGLVMWRGRHAWVMSGFESLGDPAVTADFEVTGVRVVDPLFPYGSGTWGPSPEANQLLSLDELATQFAFRERRSWSADIPAGFLLVLPVEPEARQPVPRAIAPGPHLAPGYVPLEAL